MKGDIVKIKFLDHVKTHFESSDSLMDDYLKTKPSLHIIYGEILEQTKEYIKILCHYNDGSIDRLEMAAELYGWLVLKSTIIEMKVLHERKRKAKKD